MPGSGRLCGKCGGGGRVKPAEWDRELAAACGRAEAELAGQPGCPACKGNGSARVDGYERPVSCQACDGLGKVLAPRRAPAGAWLTTAEAAGELELKVRELHALVDRRSLVPTLRNTISGARVYVFSVDAVLAASRRV